MLVEVEAKAAAATSLLPAAYKAALRLRIEAFFAKSWFISIDFNCFSLISVIEDRVSDGLTVYISMRLQILSPPMSS